MSVHGLTNKTHSSVLDALDRLFLTPVGHFREGKTANGKIIRTYALKQGFSN